MRPRLPVRRILFLRPFRPPNSPRPFTQNTLLSHSRPQLPFLSNQRRKPLARFLTTETKQWIKEEVKRGTRWTAYSYAITALALVAAWGINEAYLERKYPSPPTWSWRTRTSYRSTREAHENEDGEDAPLIDWVMVSGGYKLQLARLEDPSIDGAGLQAQGDDEGGILVEGVGKTGYDITAMPEPWRRGYYEVLMGSGKSAEHMDGRVTDTTRNISFPQNTVIGPSNPDPRPVPPNAYSAPREEDCVPSYPGPERFYLRILTTNGFTEKQKLDAALAYAAWLEYKQTPGTALEVYKWGLDIATGSWQGKPIVDSEGVIDSSSGSPTSNILTATTALAVHHASNNNLQLALPIFLSVLRARKQLPEAPSTMHSTLATSSSDEESWFRTASTLVANAVRAPDYPPPPPDGQSPPQRSGKERCEEAAVMAYIGEILFALKSSKTSRGDGLAWTREAVDVAEEELRSSMATKHSSKKKPGVDAETRKTCSQCLEVGLGNWQAMVAKMARAEKEINKAGKGAGWLGFGSKEEVHVTRWESEEAVVRERIRRGEELIGKLALRNVGLSSLFTA